MNRPEQPFSDLLPTRSSLVKRLQSWDDQEGWRVFFDTYWKLLYCVAVKAGLADSEARDVVQETVISVAKSMREGKFERRRGSFRSWLLTILHRRMIDQLRKRRSQRVDSLPHDGSATPLLEQVPAPTADGLQEIWEQEWARNLADAAIERVKQQVNAKQFQIFDLYALKGRPVTEVAKVMRVNVAQVYLAKCRITSAVKREVRALEAEAEELLAKGTGTRVRA